MIKKVFRGILRIVIWFIVISLIWVLAYKWLPVPYTPLMAIRSIEENSSATKHEWIPLEEISVNIQLAVICSEDQQFLNHNGFDYKAIKKAYEDNQKGKHLKGGSTISQQTAKNVFLWPGRSWFRKGLEAYFTFLIENLWSKERILEVYLNSIEMGNGVYGVEAASQYWFHKKAANLNRYEAASLAVILPNPRNYRATPRTPYLEKRKTWVLQQMNNFGPLDLKPKSNNHTP